MPNPVFCADCRNNNTFERKPEKDVMMGDEVFEEAWICKVCGHKVIQPVGEK